MSQTRRNPFAVKRHGRPIDEQGLRHKVAHGITYTALMPGMVPLYEEFEAMHYANYNYAEWRKIPWGERALHVAHWRNVNLIKVHINDAVADAEDKAVKKISSKAKGR